MQQKLDAKALAITLGILWSAGVLFVSIIANLTVSYLHNIAEFLTSVYPGYSLDFTGIIMGMIWAFVDAGIGGFVIAWLYNKLSK